MYFYRKGIVLVFISKYISLHYWILFDKIIQNLHFQKHNDVQFGNMLRISNFLLKILLKLCEAFWNHIKTFFKPLWNLLISIYKYETKWNYFSFTCLGSNFSYSLYYLRHKKYPEFMIHNIRADKFNQLEQFLNKLSLETSFFSVSLTNEHASCLNVLRS